MITTQVTAPAKAIHIMTAKATRPGEVPLEREDEAAVALAAAAV
jgi:hypothetical protein